MSTMIEAAGELARARGALYAAMDNAKVAAIEAAAAGVSEVEIAVTIGVNRLTVRKWLGK